MCKAGPNEYTAIAVFNQKGPPGNSVQSRVHKCTHNLASYERILNPRESSEGFTLSGGWDGMFSLL